MDGISIKGIVEFEERTPTGELVRRWTAENLVVNGGLAWLAGAMSGAVADATVAKYIRVGTGTTPAAPANTDLVTGVEGRVTGTTSRVTTTATNDTYQVIGVVTMTENRSITEVGLFTAASGGTLLSRSVFTAQPVTSGNTLTLTYKWIFTDAS
ncbi:MAG TPA: hypothetical protein VMW94_06405 [Actinomycetes bacterium]|nr:hypothetical protein [Actinomycetes bacterium]